MQSHIGDIVKETPERYERDNFKLLADELTRIKLKGV